MCKLKSVFIIFSFAASLHLTGCTASSNTSPTLEAIENQKTKEDLYSTVTLSASDGDGDKLSYSATTSESSITISVSGSTITITPDADWNGTATINALASDGTDAGRQSFTQTVTAVNDAPTLAAISNQTTDVDTKRKITIDAADVDGDSLTYTLTSVPAGKVTGSVKGSKLTLVPADSYTGTAALTLTVSDGKLTDSQTFNLSVGSSSSSIPLLLVRVQFTGAPYDSFNSSEATWANVIFGTESGNLNHYMNEVSEGSFQFTAATESDEIMNNGIVTATLGVSHPGNTHFDHSHLKEAITDIDDKVDFSSYDTNADGYIAYDELQIMYIVAGGETAYGDPVASSIWAHKWCVGSSPPTHDDVTLMHCSYGNYSRFGERHGSHDATIGIIAHELGHSAFLLPDLYDYDNSSAGIGRFGLMGAGSWGSKPGDDFAGQTPVHPTGWAKIKMGFITPTVITADGTYTANDFDSDSYNVLKINSGTTDEYFLFENRNALGYDLALNRLTGALDSFAGGMLITHIDDNETDNTNDAKRIVDIEEANNAENDSGGGGHINGLYFDGNSGTFNSTSTPNSNKNDGTASNISITNIGAQSAAMNFDVEIP